jgi:SAM-dependent methyltransferase
MHVVRKARNIVRAILQSYGTANVKRSLWNSEFRGGRWDCLENTPTDCVYSYVEKYARNGSILDLGCGSGSTGNELAAAAYRSYAGVDISDAAIEKARRRTEENGRADRNTYCRSDIVSYVPIQQFDVILFRDSIYYVPRGRVRTMLDRYSKYLNDGGVFIVRISNGGAAYKSVVETIESGFDVVEKHVFCQPEAVVIVFRPDVGVGLGSQRKASSQQTGTAPRA